MLEELQSLSQEKKKQVLIIATVIIMVIIIGVWFSYFNSIIIGTAGIAASQATSSVTNVPSAPTAPAAVTGVTSSAASAQASGPGLWQDIKDGFSSFAHIFSNPSQYKIQPN